jgi:hypothetical protein
VAVENGIITVNNGAALVLKKGNYSDFILKVKARTVGNGKGFIAFHTDNAADGYRVALNNDLESAEWWTKTGSLLSVRNLAKSTVKTDEWFDMDIQVEGKAITISVNGNPVVEYIEPTAPYRTAEHSSKLLSSGKFAIQSSEGTIEIESIEVTPLKLIRTLLSSSCLLSMKQLIISLNFIRIISQCLTTMFILKELLQTKQLNSLVNMVLTTH